MRPYLRAANVRWKGLDLSDVKQMDFTEAESATYELRPGDLLLAEASGSPGEVGKPAQYNGEIEGCCFQNTLLRVRLPDGLSPNFFEYLFREQALNRRFAAGSRGVGIHHLGASALSDWQVPVPPSVEQERIAVAIDEALSKLDAGVAGLLRVRELIKRMRHAILGAAIAGRLVAQASAEASADKLLADLGAEARWGPQLPSGWAWSEVGDLLDRIEAGKSFATLGHPAHAGEIGVIKVSAMTWGEFRADENKAIPAGSRVEPNWTIRAGDLLFSRANTSEYVGACVLVGIDHPNLILSDKSLRLVPLAGVSSAWLLHCLRSGPTRGQIEALATGTKESMRNISQAKLRRVRVALPPSDEQLRIVEEIERQSSFLDACDRAVEVGLAHSAALRRSVLKSAFEGKLVPQDPTDEPASALLERIRATGPITKPPSRSRTTA